jgi:hypothetical protein
MTLLNENDQTKTLAGTKHTASVSEEDDLPSPSQGSALVPALIVAVIITGVVLWVLFPSSIRASPSCSGVPLMPLYTVINYSVFRGKAQPSGLWGTWSRRQVNGRTPSEPGSHNPAQRC